jgi:DNA mismatch endonuclease (patch repair protein)
MVKYQMDRATSAERSAQMSLVKSKNTGPELVVRKLAHSLGYRYRLHGARLPGKPDLVFAKRKKVVFVHGCFWHRHVGCRRATTPATNLDYWLPKFERTVERDQQNIDGLSSLGWSSLVVWECELKNTGDLADKLRAFLDS